MAVGSTNDGGGFALNYSNYGPGISIVAPGGRYANYDEDYNIFSTGVHHWIDTVDENGHIYYHHHLYPIYTWGGGTSASAPFVTGVAGLVKGYAKTRNISLSNDDIRRIIEISADDIPGSEPGYDIYTGYGKVNARKALEMLNAPWQMIHGYSPAGSPTNWAYDGTFSGYVPYWPLSQSVNLSNAIRYKVTQDNPTASLLQQFSKSVPKAICLDAKLAISGLAPLPRFMRSEERCRYDWTNYLREESIIFYCNNTYL